MNTLTAGDLQAIGGVVKDIVEPRFDALERDIEALAQDTAAGFAEVHARIDAVHSELSQRIIRVEDTTDRIERVQSAEVSRLDKQELQIKKMRKVLRTA